MRIVTILVFGAFGGMCPTIARLASHYSRNPTSDLPEVGAFVAMGLFAILGAVIAVGFGAKEVKAAIVSGIAAPGLVTNIVAGAASGTAQPPADAQAFALFMRPAFAQEAAAPVTQPDALRTLTLNPAFDGAAPTKSPVSYGFVTPEGTFLPGGGILVPGETGVSVPVPDGATGLAIGGDVTPLPMGSTVADVVIQTAPTLGGDLLWALGGQRQYAVTGATVTYGD